MSLKHLFKKKWYTYLMLYLHRWWQTRIEIKNINASRFILFETEVGVIRKKIYKFFKSSGVQNARFV